MTTIYARKNLETFELSKITGSFNRTNPIFVYYKISYGKKFRIIMYSKIKNYIWSISLISIDELKKLIPRFKIKYKNPRMIVAREVERLQKQKQRFEKMEKEGNFIDLKNTYKEALKISVEDDEIDLFEAIDMLLPKINLKVEDISDLITIIMSYEPTNNLVDPAIDETYTQYREYMDKNSLRAEVKREEWIRTTRIRMPDYD